MFPSTSTTYCWTSLPAKGPGVELDALATAAKIPVIPRSTGFRPDPVELGGEAAVLPGQAVVIGKADVAVLDPVVIPHSGGGFEEACPGARRMEHKDPARFRVHQQARVPVAFKPDAGAHHLLVLPGPSAVHAAP